MAPAHGHEAVVAAAQCEFEALVARTKRQAYGMAYRMTGSREDAEDLVQEAYLRAYRSFAKYDRSLPFENWFFRILSNLFVDGLRRQPKQAPLSLSQPMPNASGGDDFLLEVSDEENNPEARIMRSVMNERLQRALAALTKEFRTAVLLCDVDGMSYEEVARSMGTSVGTVRSRIHRGRLMLRRRLGVDPFAEVPARLSPAAAA
ncbi:MAG TPA: sigma-70 family RNA polymerase sigma factor [Chthonomonadales bacterium]|nr:sigma-70 family RNA polymerase sigma factor [Chthonomonadales bacterium]